jgi:hypothetical protein
MGAGFNRRERRKWRGSRLNAKAQRREGDELRQKDGKNMQTEGTQGAQKGYPLANEIYIRERSERRLEPLMNANKH